MTATPRTGNQPTKGERTKARITDVALTMFAESGYHAVSLRDIASAAEISHVGLLHHFANKEDLLFQVLARRDSLQSLWAESMKTVLEHPPASGKAPNPAAIFAAILAITEDNQANHNLVALYVKLSAEATDPQHPAHAYFQARYQRLIATLDAAFTAWFVEHPPPTALPPQVAAHQLVALLDGLQLQWILARPDAATTAPAQQQTSPLPTDLVTPVRAYLEMLGIRPQLLPQTPPPTPSATPHPSKEPQP